MRLFVSVSALFFIMIILPIYSAGEVMQSISLDSHFQNSSEKYHFVVLQNDTGGWFYAIKKGVKNFIVQKSIPVVQGNKAFSDSIQAKKIANLAIEKLNQGIFPPTIKESELDSLNITY
jgi:hypothetical protein